MLTILIEQIRDDLLKMINGIKEYEQENSVTVNKLEEMDVDRACWTFGPNNPDYEKTFILETAVKCYYDIEKFEIEELETYHGNGDREDFHSDG